MSKSEQRSSKPKSNTNSKQKTIDLKPKKHSPLIMALILLLFCALPVAFSSTVAHRVIQHRVGQILALPTGEHHNGASYVDEAMLPGWCRFNATIRLIICIPQLADLGQSVIFIRGE